MESRIKVYVFDSIPTCTRRLENNLDVDWRIALPMFKFKEFAMQKQGDNLRSEFYILMTTKSSSFSHLKFGLEQILVGCRYSLSQGAG